jgi:beta-glucosidase
MPVSAEETARLARETDLALVTLGRDSGEFADRAREDFELSPFEQALLRDVSAAFRGQGKKLLVVLNVGGVIETASWRELADAILLAWQPGQEAGHAVADVLTGRTPPSGKLATTFPVKWEDVPSSAGFPGKTLLGPDPNAPPRGPMRGDREAEVEYADDVWVGYRHFATKGVKPAYPFGYGLSYTSFSYSELKLSRPEFERELTATISVTNSGRAPGREVVQLYLAAPGGSIPKPALELRGFAKTRLLQPGEAETLSFTLTPRDLASFDEERSAWIAEEGTYSVRVGASSEDVRQTASFAKARAERVARVSTSVQKAAK